jgi:hypothetical protein
VNLTKLKNMGIDHLKNRFLLVDMEYYLLFCRYLKKNIFIIWYSNDKDLILFNAEDKALKFEKKSDLHLYLKKHKLILKEERPIVHDLDYVINWMKGYDLFLPDCNQLLNIWNLFIDLSNSARTGGEDFKKIDNRNNKLYNKIFKNCNLPSFSKNIRSAKRTITENEKSLLLEVMNSGLMLFEDKVINQ